MHEQVALLGQESRGMATRLTPMLLAALACASPPRSSAPQPATGSARLAAAESTYAATRDLRDRMDVALAAGRHEIAGDTAVAARQVDRPGTPR